MRHDSGIDKGRYKTYGDEVLVPFINKSGKLGGR